MTRKLSAEVFLKKRVIIESVIKEIKTQTQLEHNQHRSFVNFRVNVVSALIAYQLLESKPSVNLSELQEFNDLPLLLQLLNFLGLTQQASVRRGPRASATSLFTVSLAESEADAFFPNGVCVSPDFFKLTLIANCYRQLTDFDHRMNKCYNRRLILPQVVASLSETETA